jgi:hypothetical protein
VLVTTKDSHGRPVPILLGKKFRLDVELVEKVKAIDGIGNVALEPVRHLSVVH